MRYPYKKAIFHSNNVQQKSPYARRIAFLYNHFLINIPAGEICRHLFVHLSLTADKKLRVNLNIGYFFVYIYSIMICSAHRWFSGRMLACHAGGPLSIPGRCKYISFISTFCYKLHSRFFHHHTIGLLQLSLSGFFSQTPPPTLYSSSINLIQY